MKRIILEGLGGLMVVGVVAFGLYYSASHYLDKHSRSGPQVSACPVHGKSYTAVIQNNSVVPATTAAHLCDTLTITNLDAASRLVAFGPHDNHQPYDGVTERLLSTGQSLSIVLNQAGQFSFHDHLEDIAVGSFTVSP